MQERELFGQAPHETLAFMVSGSTSNITKVSKNTVHRTIGEREKEEWLMGWNFYETKQPPRRALYDFYGNPPFENHHNRGQNQGKTEAYLSVLKLSRCFLSFWRRCF